MRARKRTISSLKLLEFNDRELLLAIRDLCASSSREGGFVTAVEFAKHIGLSGDNASRQVGARFAWMKVYGVLELQNRAERDEDEKWKTVGLWRLTQIGEGFAMNELSGPEQRALEAIVEQAALNAGMAVGETYRRLGYSGKAMMRRALRFQMQR